MREQTRPRDAAGLILMRDAGSGLEVLMGRRHAKARFMPGVYVFPGGGLDRPDLDPTGLPEQFREPHAALDQVSRKRHNAFARTALRELFEETGYLLGRPGPSSGQRIQGGAWQAYAHEGLKPAFASLKLIARAITPAGLPIRFHTRFFLASGSGLEHRCVGPGDGELEDIAWRRTEEVLGDLPTPGITKKVLGEALVAQKTAKAFAPVRYTARGSRLYIRHQGTTTGA